MEHFQRAGHTSPTHLGPVDLLAQQAGDVVDVVVVAVVVAVLLLQRVTAQ